MAVSAVKKERAKPAAGAEEAAADAKPAARGGKSKLMLVLGLVLLVGAGGGGAYWYTQHNKAGGKHERILADFLIGAHALHEANRLLTRDRGFYRRYFSGLEILSA